MKQTLILAQKAYDLKEVPVGALIVSPEGKIIGEGFNQRESKKIATAHAEVLAIEQACQNLGSWRLRDCTLYVTLEPCPMCSGAIWASQITKVIFGAYDPKAGYSKTLYQIGEDQRLNHRFETQGGVLETECSEILKRFFKELRNSNSNI